MQDLLANHLFPCFSRSNRFKIQQAKRFIALTMPIRQNFRTDFSIIAHLTILIHIRRSPKKSVRSKKETTKSHLHCYRSNAASTQGA